MTLLLLFTLTLAVAETGEQWSANETARLRFLFHDGNRGEVEKLVATAEADFEAIVSDTGYSPSVRVTVKVASDFAEFNSIQPYGPLPDWAVGVNYGQLLLVILTARSEDGRVVEMRPVLRHELSHAVLHLSAGGRPAPRWFAEGLAMRQAAEWTVERTVTLARAANFGGLIPLARLDGAFPAGHVQSGIAYAESLEFVSHLADVYGVGTLHKILSLIRGGKPFEDALFETTGKRLGQIEAEWLGKLRRRYGLLSALYRSTTFWFLLAALAVAAYLLKRRRGAAKIRRWEEEDGGGEGDGGNGRSENSGDGRFLS